MAYDLAKVTANGNNLIAQILANKSSLSVDKIEISDTQLPSTTDISTMTSVPKVVQTVSANGFSKNSNTLIISTVVDNSSIRADYKAWVFGIWGSDSQNGQSQLIAVITSTNSPDTIPAFSGRTPVSYTYKFNIGFSNASQIKFNMINDSFATNDTVVHTTGDETINGQKKFDTDPTDGAGNAYAKTVDVNQQLDKKVNVADMRKPASDVAGIEEVNVKQDKIGYTPADDSKAVHDNHDNTITANNLTYDLSKTGLTPLSVYKSGSFNDLPLGTVFAEPPMTDGPDTVHGFTTATATFYSPQWNVRKAQIAIADNANFMYFRVKDVDTWNSWTLLSDDSKVAHLSGANNFDTVPTVNNNPLLLASSLPSDLARTGQAQTFTQPQTFSIAPTIKDASKDKGDNQAATMADLKSVENSAWHQLDSSKVTGGSILNSLILYKIDEPNKKIYLSFVILQDANKPSSSDPIYFDFSGIVNKITAASGSVVYDSGGFSSIDSYSTVVMLYPEGESYMASGLTGVYTNHTVSNHNSTIPTISYDTLLI